MTGIVELSRTEVIEFHRVLEAWLRGTGPAAASGTDRMANAFAPDCTLYAPSGMAEKKPVLLERLSKARGAQPDMKITIDDFAPVWARDEVALVRYVEWREAGGQKTGRYATVLFQAAPAAPGGVVWLHIHETWMANHGPR
ncbi:DUF4440 domain-containing protein [Myxococcus sp. AM010]|uniref:DUF4440 domain-containing protein n=1 Tax=Myxococcus sp. AM010 TaxID=2745138 RepID=UPI001595C089|nr:DUF4440 domain-containing protein [Myxococcus sp. AM010]NVJ12689.1 DUF4440 domain-containing protein [Myxococcus sp. AM010]